MYTVRGYKFDPLGLHSDIRNIESIYTISGGGFWFFIFNTKIIGTLGLKIIDNELYIGELKRFFILPEFQRQGIGTKLLNHAIIFADQKQLNKLRLDTMRDSFAARRVFEKFGFYEIPQYNDNNIAEIFMEKNLRSNNLES